MTTAQRSLRLQTHGTSDLVNFVYKSGEVFYDADQGGLRLFDGITTGGKLILTATNGTINASITGNAATVTNGIYKTDTGTVTNTMLAGSIANNKLLNSSITINSTPISLGGSITGIVTTSDTGTVTNTMLAGNIANSKLVNSTMIVNGVTLTLGGTSTITAAAGTLTGTALNSTVVSSSLTSVGTLTSLTVSGTSAQAAGSFSGVLTVSNATSATSTSIGALVVTGGIATGDSIRAAGNIYSNGINLKTFSVAMGAALA